MLEKYLIDFSKEEVAIITHAIARHSDKDRIDHSYSELIKDMDILAKYYDDSSYVFKDCERKRLDIYSNNAKEKNAGNVLFYI